MLQPTRRRLVVTLVAFVIAVVFLVLGTVLVTRQGVARTQQLAGIGSFCVSLASLGVAVASLVLNIRRDRRQQAADEAAVPVGPVPSGPTSAAAVSRRRAPGKTAVGVTGAARVLSSEERQKLTQLLLAVQGIRHPATWGLVVDQLPADLANNAPRINVAHQEVLAFLPIVADYPDGFALLLAALKVVFPGSIAVEQFAGYVRQRGFA